MEKLHIGDTIIFNSIIKNSLDDTSKHVCRKKINTFSTLVSMENLVKSKDIEVIEIIR